jgi:hypothetical protein
MQKSLDKLPCPPSRYKHDDTKIKSNNSNSWGKPDQEPSYQFKADTRSEAREAVAEKLLKNIDTCRQHCMKHQEPRGLGLCMELRINHSFQRNTAGSSCAAWSLIPVDTAHHSSQRTWRRAQYSMRGIVRPQVQVQFSPGKAEEYYFDLWCIRLALSK